jgi:hypothetical protein
MSKPIYQIFIGNNNIACNQAWKSLSEAENKALVDQEKASRDAAGSKTIVLCDSAWADEMHPWWGVLRYPDLQARIQHTQTLQKIGWLDKVDAFTLLGTSESEPEEVTIPNPIYKLWLIKSNPATSFTGHMAPGLNALRWEKHNALYKQYNSQVILTCYSNWCNEAYLAFGVSVYPDIEANMKIMEGLSELGWPAYFDCVSYLGLSTQ